MLPAEVARAKTRNVTIAPARCECGRKLRWAQVEMDRGLGGPVLKRWEYATCRHCLIIWHHDLPIPHIAH